MRNSIFITLLFLSTFLSYNRAQGWPDGKFNNPITSTVDRLSFEDLGNLLINFKWTAGNESRKIVYDFHKMGMLEIFDHSAKSQAPLNLIWRLEKKGFESYLILVNPGSHEESVYQIKETKKGLKLNKFGLCEGVELNRSAILKNSQ